MVSVLHPVLFLSLLLPVALPSTLDGDDEGVPDSGPVVYTSTKYSSHSSVSYSKGGNSGSPTFEFLTPKGLKINIPKVDPESSPHKVTALINLNKEIEGEDAGWRGEKVIHSGMEWSFTLPAAKVSEGDRLFFWVKVTPPGDPSVTEGEFKGSYQVQDSNPHSGVSSPPTQGLNSGIFTNTDDLFSSFKNKDHNSLFSNSSQIKPSNGIDFSNFFTDFGCKDCSSADDFLKYTATKFHNGSPETAQPLPAQAPSQRVTQVTQSPIVREEVKETTTSTTKRPQQNSCRKSPSVLNGRAMCAGEAFTLTKFSSEQHLGENPEGVFTVYSQDYVTDGGPEGETSCRPTTLEAAYGPHAVDHNLNLGVCTAVNNELCHYSPASYLISPPVLGCRMTSKTQMTFKYGQLEVKAKLPAGEWIVSEITLEPAAWVYGQRSGKVVLARLRGNSELKSAVGVDYSSRTLEAGIELWEGPYLFRKELDKPLTDGDHVFKLIWTPEKLQFLVDGDEIGQIQPVNGGLDNFIRGTQLAPFDKEFFVQFGIHVGGNRDFPDNVNGKPWKNYERKNKLKFWQARQKWLPTWREGSSSLRILSTKITALDQ